MLEINTLLVNHLAYIISKIASKMTMLGYIGSSKFYDFHEYCSY